MNTGANFNCTKRTSIIEKERYYEGLKLLLDAIDEKMETLVRNDGAKVPLAVKSMQHKLDFLCLKKQEIIEAIKEMEEDSDEQWDKLKEFVEIEIAAFEEESRIKIGGINGNWPYFISTHKKP